MSETKFTAFANSFQAIAKPGLANIRALCAALGNPQDGLKYIHIAGTNGKGSVCAFLEAMLTKAGYRTGKYTSPNLVRVNERICVNRAEISDADLERILAKVEIACKQAEAETGAHPTQFEIWTAAAFCYFKEQNCDYVILETGLGGEKDATNVVTNTEVAVLTHIAVDHTEYLGNTLTEIAQAKAGIIKPSCKVVSAPQEVEVAKVFDAVCKEKGCVCAYTTKVTLDRFDGVYEYLEETKLALGGINQLENAALAKATAAVLGLSDEDITYGLTHAAHPARFEKITDVLYYDGAHNPDGVTVLLQNINRYFPSKRIAFVMATMADKDIRASLEMLRPHATMLCTVTVKDNPRAMSAAEFAKIADSLGIKAQACNTLTDAVQAAQKEADITIICGSLYLYKDFDECRNEIE